LPVKGSKSAGVADPIISLISALFGLNAGACLQL